MKILLITQDEPFYLAESINYLLNRLPVDTQVVGCCLFDVSPFGKKESFIDKAIKTYKVFGAKFFLYYAVKFVLNKLSPNRSVLKTLKKQDVPVIRLEQHINHPESIDLLKSYESDLLISIAGNQIFKKPIIELAPKGCLNLHTALLPKYRGLMPTFWALKNNEKYTGVSVFFVDEGIDSGPIIVQKKIDITNIINQSQLIKHSKIIGMDAIIEAINLIQNGDYQLIENDDSKMTYYSFPERQDVIDFLKKGKRFY